MVRATLDDIAAKTGSSRSTVARLMASLRKANVVRLEHGGRWMLNPAVVFKGAQPPNECADSLSSDGTTRASLGARRERAEGCLMPIIEMVLPGEPKQQPEHVAGLPNHRRARGWHCMFRYGGQNSDEPALH